jgi:hypothetical protein
MGEHTPAFQRKDASPFNVIRLWEPWTECCICDEPTPLRYAVAYCCGPTHDEIGEESSEYPGTIVGGMPACKRCHDQHYAAALVTPSTDTPINDGNGGAERDAKVTACKCSPEDVHNYGPCDESCSSLTVFRHGGADV